MEEILELLTPRCLAEEVKALAQSGETIDWEELMYRTWRRCSADELDEEDFESLEDLIEEDEMIWRFEEVLQQASPRFVALEYDDAMGTDLTYRFFADKGVVLTMYVPNQSEISAHFVEGEAGFVAFVREKLAKGFDEDTWNRASAEFSSGVLLEAEEDYPVGDDSFWEELLAQRSDA